MTPAKERLAWVLTFTPEPYTVQRGVSAGGEPLWGAVEPGSYTPEHRVESALALDPSLAYDIEDGSALRGLVRDYPGYDVQAEYNGVSWGVMMWNGLDGDDWREGYGDGRTIAEASDACREMLVRDDE